MSEARQRFDEWRERCGGLDFFGLVSPNIRADGVLELVGTFDRYPIDENCNLETARRVHQLIVARQNDIRRRINRPAQ